MLLVALLGSLTACDETKEDTSQDYFQPVKDKEDHLPAQVFFKPAEESFDLIFDTGQDWVASLEGTDTSWLHLGHESGSKGENTLRVTADANPNDVDRTATVFIMARSKGKRVQVTQYAKNKRFNADRSVLVYLAAENSLYSYAATDVKELIQGARWIPENTHLLLYLDDLKLPRIYEVGPTAMGIGDTIRVVDFDQEYDSANPATLKMTLDFMKENYPADEYGLVMWSHGEGWIPGNNPQHLDTRFIGIDNNTNTSSNKGTQLSVWDVREAVKYSLGSCEFIFFDACFMSTVEVAYELRDCCHYVIGSPCEVPAYGAPYNVLTPLFFEHDMGTCNAIKTYYEHYAKGGGETAGYGVVLSQMDCSKFDSFLTSTLPYLNRYMSATATIQPAADWVQYGFKNLGIGSRSYVYMDMRQVMQSLLTAEEYTDWKKAFDQLVVGFYATPYWFSEFAGTRQLDLEKVGGVAFSIPHLIDTPVLDAFGQTYWYHDVWKQAGW